MTHDPLNAMTAAGGTIRIGDDLYILSQPTLGDLSDYSAWLRDRLRERLDPLEQVRPRLAGLPPAAQERLAELAYRDSVEFRKQKLDLESPEAKEIQESIDGIAFILWLAVRRRHPEMTLKRVREFLGDQAVDLEAIKSKLSELGEGLQNPPTKEAVSPPIPSPGS